MRLAWCQSMSRRPASTSLSDARRAPSERVDVTPVEGIDDSAALIAQLRSRHDVTLFERHSIHDLVRLHFRQPFDLCIYELADTDDSAFLWPYVMHYPGVVRLRSASLHHSRGDSLARQRRGRDRDAELAFGRGDLTAAAIVASRCVVVADEYQAAALQHDYPDSRIRVAPIGVKEVGRGERFQPKTPDDGMIRIGVLAHPLRRTIVEGIDRARGAGAPIEVAQLSSADRVLDEADVALFLPWLPSDDLTPAIAALAAGRPLVAFETPATAAWPVLDPQTWLMRGIDVSDPPIAVTIDPRDESHSLALALRRLATDPTLRDELGRSAHEWWRRHATVAHAVDAWSAIVQEAAALAPPRHPPNWPAHLTADGTARARELLAPFGVSVDFLEESGIRNQDSAMG